MLIIRKFWPLHARPAVRAALAMAVLTALALWIILGVSANQPKPVDLANPQAQEIANLLRASERLFGEVACNPAVDVVVLDEVLADWSGYRLGTNEKAMVVRVYGQSAGATAGFLTYRKAYYLSMRGDYPGADAAPENGLRPTSRPQIYCPTPAPEQVLSIQSVAIGPNQAVARYDSGPALCEAVLIKVEGRWKIASLKYLESYF